MSYFFIVLWNNTINPFNFSKDSIIVWAIVTGAAFCGTTIANYLEENR